MDIYGCTHYKEIPEDCLLMESCTRISLWSWIQRSCIENLLVRRGATDRAGFEHTVFLHTCRGVSKLFSTELLLLFLFVYCVTGLLHHHCTNLKYVFLYFYHFSGIIKFFREELMTSSSASGVNMEDDKKVDILLQRDQAIAEVSSICAFS